MEYIDKNFLIMGFGISGQGVYDTLSKLVANVFVYYVDSKKMSSLNIKTFRKITKKIIQDMDYIIISPTIKLTKKIQNIAKKNKTIILSELDFAYTYNKGNILAVTGSNGKTTTVSLLKDLLDTLPKNNHLLGNIGVPFSKKVLEIEKEDNVILECSSFQLMQSNVFKPHIAGILNLAPDHLDFHKSLEEYYSSKIKIFSNQNEEDYAVINFDNELCVELTKNVKSQKYYFSTKSVCKGMFVADDMIYFSDGYITYSIVKLENIRYVGEHNLSNYLCASLMAILSGVSIENIAYMLNNFRLPAHRLEFVRRLNDVDYYNDSKATNIEATLTDCRAFDKPIHLIVGGSDKGEKFNHLIDNLPNNVKCLYVYGQTQKKIYKSAKRKKDLLTIKCDKLDRALNYASLKAKKGEIVLLSPACASFDSFDNFEERGNYFKNLVNDL